MKSKELRKELGLTIKNKRKKLGLTQLEVCDKVGIDKCNYSSFENGNRGILMDKVLLLLDYLGLKIK